MQNDDMQDNHQTNSRLTKYISKIFDVSTRFTFVRKKTYTCNGITNIMKEYFHKQTGLEFVLIPGGIYTRQSQDGDKTKQSVVETTLPPYLISKKLVTQSIWYQIMETIPSYFKARTTIQVDYPVEQVSWDDCQKFCQLTGLKLPTEAQWEYAARGGSTTQYYFGDTSHELDKYAWYNQNSHHTTHNVAGKLPNAYGLYDMLGNVWEWCQDFFEEETALNTSTSSKTTAQSYEHILKGGCFDLGAMICRITFRNCSVAGCRSKYNGFRVVTEFTPAEKKIVEYQESQPSSISEIIFAEAQNISYDNIPGFRFSHYQSCTCDSMTNKMAIYIHQQTNLEFVLIPIGTFSMGSNIQANEQPIHQVTLTVPYLMSRTPVTQGVWQKVMHTNASRFKKGDNYPVDSVTWHEAISFCQCTGLSIPTEAQWEYACRAGSAKKYFFGNSFQDLGKYAWYYSNSSQSSHPVGTKLPNAFGLYDMLGDVCEWCQDWFDSRYPSDPVVNPLGKGTRTSHCWRGGGWSFDHEHCRSAYRGGDLPDERNSDYGLRVVAMVTNLRLPN